jgi:hypothetical protein
MTSDLVPWLVAGGLAVVVVVLVILLRRHQTSARAELDAAERARAAEVARLDAEHREQAARHRSPPPRRVDVMRWPRPRRAARSCGRA